MANTIIQLKNSGVPGNVPATLQPGELAVNYNDGKLYYGNSSNTAVLFDAITEPSGLNGEIQFNSSGVFGASANLKFDTSTKTLTVDEVSSRTTDRIFSHANGAFSTANTKLNTAGGTISGDLLISGNLTITGNTVTHSANDFIVNDGEVYKIHNRDSLSGYKPGGPIDREVKQQATNSTNITLSPLTINGTIKLEGNSGGSSVDLSKNPLLIRELSRLISLEIKKSINGGKVNSNPSS